MIRSLTLTLSLALLAALPAQAESMVGASAIGHRNVACDSLFDFEKARVIAMSRARDEGAISWFKQAMDSGRCRMLPDGFRVYVMKEIAGMQCLRPMGDTECYWTTGSVGLDWSEGLQKP